MKKLIFTFGACALAATMIASCGDKNQAQEQAKQVQAAIKKNVPGTVATTADGYTMKAKLNGKAWTAGSIMPPDAAGRIVGYSNEEYIGLPYDRRYLVVGKKITFGEGNAVDLATNDDVGLWGGRKGEMEITKVDDKWAEGKFFFTASTSRSSKTVEVTDGFFRIPAASGK
jgi:hypothetical protein